jgi:hypothetical protein
LSNKYFRQGWNRSPGFSSGSGIGSASRGSTFKHALAGAAIGTIGGLLVFEAGKAIISSATTPFHHSGRDYYFDQQNYRGPSGVPRCSMPLNQLTNTPSTPVTSSENGTNADQTLANVRPGFCISLLPFLASIQRWNTTKGRGLELQRWRVLLWIGLLSSAATEQRWPFGCK